MKKLIFIAIASLAITSCTKEYNCNCVDPDNSANDGVLPLKTNKKSEATRFCNDYESKVRGAGISTKYECKID